MGRGLSLLQRQILRLTFREKFVTCEEILTNLRGWPGQEMGSKKPIIDKAKYATAHSALSRSLTRLWERGLITYWRTLTHYRTGVTLTAKGKVLAHAILAEDQEGQFND